jgi:hypothetical protein
MTNGRWIAALSLVLLTAHSFWPWDGPWDGPTDGLPIEELVSVGSLLTVRAAHQATLLPDGAVLITGGCTDEGCARITASVELYDPDTRSFQPAPPLALPRSGHVAIRLHDGRVLVAGGWTGSVVTATAEVYDPVTRQWAAAGSLRYPRQSPIARLLPDGRVLIVGGAGESMAPLASAEIFDPRSDAFVVTGGLSMPRASPAAAALDDGRILVTGGNTRRRGPPLASTEIYDPATGRFHPAAAMGDGRYKHAAVRMLDGRVLVIAGSDGRDSRGLYRSTEIFDPVTARFSRGPELESARYKIRDAVVVLPSGAVVVAGGAARAERLPPAARAGFSRVPGEMDAARSFATATVLNDGSVLVAGGYDGRIRPTAAAWLAEQRHAPRADGLHP